VIVQFVDIGGIVDHHCLSSHNLQPVFVFTPKYCVVSKEIANVYFILFVLIGQRLKPIIYYTQRSMITNT
jgi:hypothetical protein